MKKILLLIFCIILTSCDNMMVHMDGWATPVNSNDQKLDVSIYEYDGHTYLIFGHTSMTNGVVHSPDCACNAIKEE